jgi:hypothetical protein
MVHLKIDLGGSRRILIVLDDVAVEDANGASAVGGDVGFVGDDYDGLALGMQGVKERHDFRRGSRVEVSRRFVGKENRWFADEGACDGDALALSARELIRSVIESIAESHLAQGFGCALAAFGRRHAPIHERLHDVLQGGLTRKKMKTLKYEADFSVSHGCELIFTQ